MWHYIKVSKNYVKSNIDAFVKIENFYFKNDSWALENFLIDLPEKFKYSFAFANEKEVCGYCIASQKFDSYYVHRFVVAREFIGSGLSKDMMKAALDIAKNNNIYTAELSVHKENKRAISFYRKFGFLIDSSRGDYHIMKLKIAKMHY